MDSFDLVSSATHFGMAVWCLFAGLFLWRLSAGHGPARRWSVALYAGSAVLLYTASGVFHGLMAAEASAGRPRAELLDLVWVPRRVDKSAIFLLILGSNLPIMVYLLRGAWRWVCVAGMSACAAAGVASVWVAPNLPHPILVALYIGMGVFGLVPVRQYVAAVGFGPLCWVLLFAAVYIAGAAADVAWWPTLVPGVFGPHELLHVCDMLATLIHYGFLLRFVVAPAVADGGSPPAPRTKAAGGLVLAPAHG